MRKAQLACEVVLSEDPQPKSHGKSLKKSNVLLCSVNGCQQSVLKEIHPEYSLEGLILKLQFFGPIMQRADSLQKTLMLGKIEGKRRRGQERIRCLDSVTDSEDMHLSKLQEIVKDREAWHLQAMGLQRVRHNLPTKQQQQQGREFIFQRHPSV